MLRIIELRIDNAGSADALSPVATCDEEVAARADSSSPVAPVHPASTNASAHAPTSTIPAFIIRITCIICIPRVIRACTLI